MSAERAKPFVAWMLAGDLDQVTKEGGRLSAAIRRSHTAESEVPVVVTPLLPEDPRPGETWVTDELCPLPNQRVEIVSAPYGPGLVACRHEHPTPSGHYGGEYHVSRLRRPPALRTVTLALTEEEVLFLRRPAWSMTEAEKIIAKLAASMEEVG